MTVLREHKEQMDEDGFRTDDDALIFQTRPGAAQSRHNVYRSWTAALQKISVEGAGLHSLRHTFVSRLAERGVPSVTTAKLVGHSQVETTERVYTKLRGSKSEQVEKLREALL